MKYTDTMITFREVPDEVSLCINISGCPNRCKGCHSPELWEDIGTELNEESLTKLINENDGITCVGFMGGDANPDYIIKLSKFVKDNFSLKTCWYSGREQKNGVQDLHCEVFDYIKLGSYKEDLGGLDSPTTNQQLFKVNVLNQTYDRFQITYYLDDITSKFWKNEQSNS